MGRRNKENEPPIIILDSGSNTSKAKSKRAIWNKMTLGVLLDTLAQQKAAGNQTDNAAWKADAWTACEAALAGTESGPNGSGGPPKTAKMCSTRWVSEKADYLIVKSLREKSGWGWDDERHLIVVSDDIWEEFIKTCPTGVKKWRTKPYYFFDEMADLVDGGVATGTSSFFPGQEHSQPNTEEDDFPLDPALRGEGGIFCAPSPEEPIDWEESNKGSDDHEPKALSSSKKRTRANSDTSPTSTGKRQRTDGHGHGRKPSAGHAIFAVSESLKEVASALGRDPGGPSSPQRKTDAIKAVMKMPLHNDDKVRALQLIRSDTSVADVLLAISEDDPMRQTFLLAEIGSNTRD
ncbi:hypothetical protein DFH08DRAFT_715075 [Mycena albidolilacea]|uniref:Myb/SANT-like domain-containing protein n=1 Tax=Mycena albidolilacea TaxID=1033008 RepID=A0AAD6ZD22_9AGAR|nr:hypothetical protein DFH08DRAFT_715075 [Mycena albidolilacea]